MKKIFYTLGIAFFASASLVSCSKGDYSSGDGQTGFNRFSNENNKPAAPTSGNFTSKINGASFKADDDKAWAYGDAAAKVWLINGFKGAGTYPQGFVLSINKNENGTYVIDPTDLSAGGSGVYQAEGSSSAVVANTGKVTITEISDTKIKGTFELKAAGFDVTEGAFDVPIVKEKK